MGQKALDTYSLETYIEMDKDPNVKYEFYDGFILAMAGGSPTHSKLAGNWITALNNAFRTGGKNCDSFGSDLKIAINKINRRLYPDVSVVCGPFVFDAKEPNAITNPVLVVEVLSESTESLDRGDKFIAYRQLPSLREYILVSQTEALVEVFSRVEDNTWKIQTLTNLEEEFDVPALGIRLKMADIYYRVEGLKVNE